MHLNKRCKNIYTKSQFNALQTFIFAAGKSQGQPEIFLKKTAMMRRRVVRIQADCFGLIDDTKLQCSCQPSLSPPYFQQTLSPIIVEIFWPHLQLFVNTLKLNTEKGALFALAKICISYFVFMDCYHAYLNVHLVDH